MSGEQYARLDHAALDAAIHAQGAGFHQAITVGHSYLFADVPVFVTSAQIAQMQAVIRAVERVVKLPGWTNVPPLPNPPPQVGRGYALGVFYGYDFHLNAAGAHLIEINTNAGGAFLNTLLLDSQRDVALPGAIAANENLEQIYLAMFRHEWQLERSDAPLKTVAIVDEQPESQYLYPEFLLAQKMFERAGIAAFIADPDALKAGADGLDYNGQRIDLIYNRLTDFNLYRHPHIRTAHEKQQVVLTPNPAHYQSYADKRKLALLTDGAWLSAAGVPQSMIDTLLQNIPQTRIVHIQDADRRGAEQWWAERKQWFFKPVNGYGSKGAYRGDKLTRRVFGEIMHSDYVAQKLVAPGEIKLNVNGADTALKYDVRCYVYDGQVQLMAARLYQGQTTNFRTPGGGFAVVRVVG